MEHKHNHKARTVSLAVFAALISLTAGCGDGFFTKGDGFVGSALSERVRDAMGDAEVDVFEYTGCEVTDSSDPDARCKGVSDTQIEVFIDGQSIIFDFSNVTKDGKISEADFEGYIVSVTEDSNLPPILEAIVDATKSTVASKDVDVDFDDKNVAVNFQGLDYDDATFVKIDLLFDEGA